MTPLEGLGVAVERISSYSGSSNLVSTFCYSTRAWSPFDCDVGTKVETTGLEPSPGWFGMASVRVLPCEALVLTVEAQKGL